MSENNASGWERSVLEKVALAAVDEQRRARRWGIFFKFLVFAYLFAVLLIAMGWMGKRDGYPAKHTALVDISGVIGPGTAASADNIMQGLAEAFKDKRTQGIVLRINSPAAVRCRRATSMMKSNDCAPSIRRFRCMPWWRTFAHPGVTTWR